VGADPCVDSAGTFSTVNTKALSAGLCMGPHHGRGTAVILLHAERIAPQSLLPVVHEEVGTIGGRVPQHGQQQAAVQPSADSGVGHQRTYACAGGAAVNSTGAGGDNGTGKIQKRREISVGSYDDQSHDLHPHSYWCRSRGSRRRWAQGDQAAHATHIPAIPALLLTLSMLWCVGGGVGGTARRCGEQRLGPTELHLRIMHGPMHVM
jgi:hypothetical protein